MKVLQIKVLAFVIAASWAAQDRPLIYSAGDLNSIFGKIVDAAIRRGNEETRARTTRGPSNETEWQLPAIRPGGFNLLVLGISLGFRRDQA